MQVKWKKQVGGNAEEDGTSRESDRIKQTDPVTHPVQAQGVCLSSIGVDFLPFIPYQSVPYRTIPL